MSEALDLAALDFDPSLREALREAPVVRVRLATRHDVVRFVTSDPRFCRTCGRPSIPAR
ncbi:hypothetical protein [Streptomyces longisporoflavus]|uniref:ISL3 family transposase n=1 Tax=Streptomyces longisporoflavus TaxID=28044 RepID=A0ABW7R3J5_9ACTN